MNNIFLKKWLASEHAEDNAKSRLPVVPILNISLNKENRGPSTSVGTGCRSLNRGFTLIEILVALSIGAAIATVITLVTSAGLSNVRNTHRRERLQTNGIFIADRLGYWVKQGTLLETPTAEELKITVPTATSTDTAIFKLNGNRVTLDDAAITSDDVLVTYLSFRKFSRSVRVGFTVTSVSGDESLSATTTLAQRNSF